MINYEGKHLYGIDAPWDDSIRVILGGDGFPVKDIWFKTTETVTE